MAWSEITETEAKAAGLTGPELNAARTVALASGITDSFVYVRDRVVAEVRGRVKACPRNTQMGPEGTIPDECMEHALALLIARLARRIPGRVVLTPERADAEKSALQFLRDVAACEVAITPPTTASDEPSASPSLHIIKAPARKASASDLSGL